MLYWAFIIYRIYQSVKCCDAWISWTKLLCTVFFHQILHLARSLLGLLLQKKILELICKLEINLIALDASNGRALLRYFDLLVHW